MKHFYTFLVLSLLGYPLGCKKYSDYKNSFGSILIVPKNVQIKKVKVISWKVGPSKKQELSRGISLQINLPLLANKHFTDLINKDINTWILRVNRERISAVAMEHLEYISVPLALRRKQRTYNYQPLKQLQTGTLNIFYAASTVSSRLFKMNCPGLDHRKIIKQFKIVPEYSINKSIHVSAIYEAPMEVKQHQFGYQPHTVNGGKNLAGIYTFDLALYNSKGKKLVSNWYRLNNKVEITDEEEVSIKGCNDSHSTPELHKKR